MNRATVTRNEGSGARRGLGGTAAAAGRTLAPGAAPISGFNEWISHRGRAEGLCDEPARTFETSAEGPGWPAYLPEAGITRPEKAAPSISASLTRLSLVPSVSLLQILPINRSTATLRSIKRSDGAFTKQTSSLCQKN